MGEYWSGIGATQPPLGFYKYIITKYHSRSNISICTEAHARADGQTGGNPVVEALLRWRPSILFPDLRQDAGVVLGTRYLVTATLR